MKKFEYKRVAFGYPASGNEIGHDINPILKENGEAGWELVSVIRLLTGNEIGYFKREIK